MTNNTYKTSEDRFKLIRLLGKGASAQAFEARDRATKETVALKIVSHDRVIILVCSMKTLTPMKWRSTF